MTACYKILVKGKVQGVWFRKYTKDKANSLHLNGFVRNEPDRSVYIEVEGEEEELAKFIDWLAIGSPLSQVTGIEFEPLGLPRFTCFEIRS